MAIDSTTDPTTLHKEDAAAAYLQVAPKTMQGWRFKGGGPKFIRISNRTVRYRKVDLDDWIASRRVSNTKEQPFDES